MFDEFMLPEQADLSRDESGSASATLALRLPWYRSLPLSCVDGIDIAIDGIAVPTEQITISVGDAMHPISEVGDLAEVEWFVLDRAVARFPVVPELAAGSHAVDLTLTLRIPYAEPEYWPIDFTQTAQNSRSINFLGRDS